MGKQMTLFDFSDDGLNFECFASYLTKDGNVRQGKCPYTPEDEPINCEDCREFHAFYGELRKELADGSSVMDANRIVRRRLKIPAVYYENGKPKEERYDVD